MIRYFQVGDANTCLVMAKADRPAAYNHLPVKEVRKKVVAVTLRVPITREMRGFKIVARMAADGCVTLAWAILATLALFPRGHV